MKKYILGLILAGCLSNTTLWAQNKEQAIDLLMKKKDVEGAKSEIDKVMQSSGKSDAKAQFYKGMIYKAVYDDEALRQTYRDADLESYRAYKKAIEMGDPKEQYPTQSREDMFELAVIFASTANGAYEDAMRNDQSALKRAVEYFDAFLDVYKTVPVEQANIDKTLKENELDYNRMKYLAANVKEKSGDKVAAEKYYQELVDIKYNDAAVYLSLKSLYVSDGKRDKAAQVLTDGRNRLPEATEIALEYANLIMEDKRYEEALDTAKSAAKRDKNSGLPYVTMGEIYERMANLTKAEETYKKGIDIAPDDFEPAHGFGNYYYRKAEATTKKEGLALAKEHYLAAITFYESANRADPKNQDNLAKLYDCYMKTGNERKADQIKSRMK